MTKTELLSSLRTEVENCRNCRLGNTRTNIVFGEGNPDSPLLIIGEGPGATEDATGHPFVGRAGKLLTECLLHCGITRDKVFIANVLKCRACEITPNSIKNRPPMLDEIEPCKQWLTHQLQIIQPLVILTLGAPAAKLMLNRNSIAMTKERGYFYESPYGIPVIPSLHPSYILRNMYKDGDKSKLLLIRDIEAARRKIIEIKKSAAQHIEEANDMLFISTDHKEENDGNTVGIEVTEQDLGF